MSEISDKERDEFEERLRQGKPADPLLLEKLYKYMGTSPALTHEELDEISRREAAEYRERIRLRREAEAKSASPIDPPEI